MKTTQELYNKHKKTISGYSTGYLDSYYSEDAMKLEQFSLALADFKQSIIGLIDGALKDNWNEYFKEPNDLHLYTVLTELKQKIEAL